MSNIHTPPSGENPPDRPGVYFCHQCNRRIHAVTEEFTCQRCNSGFIEEVAEAPAAPSPPNPDEDYFMHGNPFAGGQMDVMSHILGSLFANGAAGGGGGGFVAGVGGGGGGGGGIRIRQFPAPAAGGAGAGGHAHFAGGHQNPFLQDLLANLAGIQPQQGGGHIQFIPGGGVTMYGNPGDYVWGRGGLDAIVTQLLNQMDGTGPPPLRGDTIKSIPVVKVTQEHVDAHAQCSVCWDDFKLAETVRQLNCEHIYHEACIVPWLELHGTCPVCRRSQEKEDAASGSSSSSTPSGPRAGSPAASAEAAGNATAQSSSLGSTISSVFNLFGFPTSGGSGGNNPNQSAASSGGGASRNPAENRRGANGEEGPPPPSRSQYEDFDLE